MAFLFRSKPKTDIAKNVKDSLGRLAAEPNNTDAHEQLAKLLPTLKQVLQGTSENETDSEQILQLVTAMIQQDLFYLLARCICLLNVELIGVAQSILSFTIRYKPANRFHLDPPVITHIIDERPEVIYWLCLGYEKNPNLMWHNGKVLREALKYEGVARTVLYNQDHNDPSDCSIKDMDTDAQESGEGLFWKFFYWIDTRAFEASADCFNTFKARDLITVHKKVVAHYIMINFDLFFERYHESLVQSKSYVTKRQSIKLLGELLLDRANYNVMMKYVESGAYLKLCMNLLKDDRKMIQYEGFHVFKVFVANPKKSDEVKRILLKNQERLLRFLPDFLAERDQDDEQFRDEKNFLWRTIKVMPEDPFDIMKGNPT